MLHLILQVMNMGKILSSSSKPERSFQLKKHKINAQSDHITKLPDEVLCDIISHLTLAEAARTSVLARRWNTLWYHYHGALEIDDTDKIMSRNEGVNEAVEAYLNSNKQVLQLLLSPSLDAFKMRCYSMNRICRSHHDFCVQFAMKRKMKTFELDARFPSCPFYNFPLEFLVWIKSSCGLNNISFLMSISLKYVIVSEDLIHHLLVNCPLLECLHVRSSHELLNPKFIGETLKLKYLEILGLELESLEISAPNLMSLVIDSWKVKLLIMYAPKLVEMSIPVKIINDRPESVSSYLPNLERLTWNIGGVNQKYSINQTSQIVEHNRLQHLTWILGSYYGEYTIMLNSLLEASPLLQKFTMVIYGIRRRNKDMVQTITAKHPFQCLKVLQIDGFTGADTDVNLVKYFLANTTSLEEIIIDTVSPCNRTLRSKGKPRHLKRSMKGALKLKEYIPERVSLVILD